MDLHGEFQRQIPCCLQGSITQFGAFFRYIILPDDQDVRGSVDELTPADALGKLPLQGRLLQGEYLGEVLILFLCRPPIGSLVGDPLKERGLAFHQEEGTVLPCRQGLLCLYGLPVLIQQDIGLASGRCKFITLALFQFQHHPEGFLIQQVGSILIGFIIKHALADAQVPGQVVVGDGHTLLRAVQRHGSLRQPAVFRTPDTALLLIQHLFHQIGLLGLQSMHRQYPAGAGGCDQAILADGPGERLFLPYGAQLPFKICHQGAVAFRACFRISRILFFLRKFPDPEGKLGILLPVILLCLFANVQILPLVVVGDGHRGIFLTQNAVTVVSLAYPVVAKKLRRLLHPEGIPQKTRCQQDRFSAMEHHQAVFIGDPHFFVLPVGPFRGFLVIYIAVRVLCRFPVYGHPEEEFLLFQRRLALPGLHIPIQGF